MPQFSIVTPVYRPDPSELSATVEAVLAQTITDWELILVDDHSQDAQVAATLSSFAARDPRIRVYSRTKNGGIVAASNDGIDFALGQWLVFLDDDDLLTTDALAALKNTITDHPKVGYIYSDEDKVDGHGHLSGTYRKPDWSPELERHVNYTNHLSAFRTDLVRKVGKLRPEFEGSQDHDLVLRVTEQAGEVVHIPRILYHWRMSAGSVAADPQAKQYATDSGMRAVQEHLTRLGFEDWKVVEGRVPHSYATQRSYNADKHFVSVVIPTNGSRGLVWGQRRHFVVDMVRSIVKSTEFENYEVVVVYDPDTPEEDLEALRTIAGPHLNLVLYTQPFNFSDKCNRGALAAVGDRLVFMNDDMEVITRNFLGELVAPLEETSVGITGARLLYGNRTIQNAGIGIIQDALNHPYSGRGRDEYGFSGEIIHDREVSAATGACIAMRREVFEDAGGWPLEFPNNFNDVDLCFRVRHLGYRIVSLARVECYHFESASRDNSVTREEHEGIENRIGWTDRDPYTPMGAREMINLPVMTAAPDYRAPYGRPLPLLGSAKRFLKRSAHALAKRIRAVSL